MIVKIFSEGVAMDYSEKELSEIIREYMLENKSFSFQCICNYILDKALSNDRVLKKKNTEYRGGIKIAPNDEILISKLLWEEIWDKKLFINFAKNPYITKSDEFIFIVKQ